MEAATTSGIRKERFLPAVSSFWALAAIRAPASLIGRSRWPSSTLFGSNRWRSRPRATARPDLSNQFPDQHRHPVAPGHHLVIMSGRLDQDIDQGLFALIVDDDSLNALADAEPDAVIQAQRRRD